MGKENNLPNDLWMLSEVKWKDDIFLQQGGEQDYKVAMIKT